MTDFFRSWAGADLFAEMRRLQDEVNRLFSSYQFAPSISFPPVNAFANEDGIALSAQLPGVEQDDLEISVFRDTLTLRGKRQPATDQRQAYHRRARPRRVRPQPLAAVRRRSRPGRGDGPDRRRAFA